MPTGGEFGLPGFDPTYEPTGLPSYGLGIPSYGTLPSGGSGFQSPSSSPGLNKNQLGSLVGAGLGLAGAFGGAGDSVTSQIGQVQKQAQTLAGTGGTLVGMGTEALAPVLQYLKAIASGDPSAVLGATSPQRQRVMDQYDSARKAIASFSPRGGGQTSALAENRTKEASDLATTTSAARTQGVQDLAQVGQTATSQGISAEQASTQAMASVLQPLLQQEGMDTQNTQQTFSSIGELLGLALMFA